MRVAIESHRDDIIVIPYPAAELILFICIENIMR